jgi:hypothetical protein
MSIEHPSDGTSCQRRAGPVSNGAKVCLRMARVREVQARQCTEHVDASMQNVQLPKCKSCKADELRAELLKFS